MHAAELCFNVRPHLCPLPSKIASKRSADGRGEEVRNHDFWFSADPPANPDARFFKTTECDSPSPGGEGLGEVGRKNKLPCLNAGSVMANLMRLNLEWLVKNLKRTNIVFVKTKTTKLSLQRASQGLLGEIFFDVPVYRLSQEEYEAQQQAFFQKSHADSGLLIEGMYRRHPDIKEQWQRHYEEIGGGWLFNEVIGYIRLFFYGTQIRGEYWRVKAKKLVKSRTKIFSLHELKVADEEEIPPGISNSGIFKLVLNYLTKAQNTRAIRGRFIHTSVLEYIGPYIDWNALLGLAQ